MKSTNPTILDQSNTYVAEHRKALNLNNKKYAYDVGDWIKKVLSLNIDTIKMVEKIQGKY